MPTAYRLSSPAEYENPLIDIYCFYCFDLAYRLAAAKRRAPPFMWMKGHNHTSTIAHINTAEDNLGRAMLAFMNETAPYIKSVRKQVLNKQIDNNYNRTPLKQVR
jgi:hypothetical protein